MFEEGEGMGVWGVGNFDSNQAVDYLALDVQRPLLAKIAHVMANPSLAEADERSSFEMMAAVEVLNLLYEHVGGTPPQPQEVALWKEQYLRIWDGYIDQLSTDKDYKWRRRAVILASFERMERIAFGYHGGQT
jgi:hypothetical protein